MPTSEPQYLYLTTIGRKSGRAHQIEIWFVQYAGSYYLVSERREQSDWVQNILANPSINVSVGERAAPAWNGLGRTVDVSREPELHAAVRALMDAKYGWSSGLIIELKPAKENPS